MFNFIEFIRTKWIEYSDFSGQKGTPIDELAVIPTGLVMADFQNTLVAQRNVNNLSAWETMTEDELDRFGNKFFTPRVVGGYAHGYIRIYKNEKEDIVISEDATAISDNSYRFVAVDPGTISASSFKTSTDRFALYYVDIPMIAAQQGDLYNIDASQITALENVDFQYVTVTNPVAMTGGLRTETNAEYFERLQYALHDGSMMNRRSTYAMLKEMFPLITRVYIAGAGDKYMQRDLLVGRMEDEPNKKAEFLGKIPGDNIIKNVAFWANFPPQAGSEKADIFGPFSKYSEYEYPLTIEPFDDAEMTADEDPALHGYPLDQEATAEQYQGMYFDDFSRGMTVTTTDLFNIYDEEVGFDDVVVPSSDWDYGAHGYGIGDFSQLLNEELKSTDLIKFNDNVITMGAGATNPISVSKDILKRAGLKVTGSFIIPDIATDDPHAYDSSFQIMVGGINDAGIVDAFTGVGFGVSVFQAYVAGGNPDDYNANVYFAHSERYGDSQVFAYSDDGTDHNFDNMTAMQVRPYWIEPGQEYEFEFVIDDALKLTLYLNRVAHTGIEAVDTLSDFETTKMMNVYGEEYLDADSTRYGTRMKLTLDTGAQPVNNWVFSNLKVFDIASKRANALLVFNVDNMESPIDILFRGSGSGAMNESLTSGYKAYIWDSEKHTIASGTLPLTNGGWTELTGLSNADGSIDSVSNVLTQTINSIDRYVIDSRFGKAIFIMVTTTGTSLAKILYNGKIGDDIHSEMVVDYAAIENTNADSYHAHNKADVYVVTEKNSEAFETTFAALTKTSGDTYFTMDSTVVNMPISEIVSVSLSDAVTGDVSQVLSDTDYRVIRDTGTSYNSMNESISIFLINDSSDSITVEYRTYKDISSIQEFYSDSQYAKIFGDILVKHKIPVLLDFSIVFSGPGTEQDIINQIRLWLDENIDGTFSVREMVNHLYETKLATGIQQPIEITYTAFDDDMVQYTDTFSDEYVAKDIEFFKIQNVSVQKM